MDFNQGLDIRLINEKNLAILKKIKIKMIHFAFDRWEDKDIIEPKLRLFRSMSKLDHRHVSVYILTNFNTTIRQDLYRIQLCRELDMMPYPMIYDKAHCNPIYRKMQRWCNPVIFFRCPTLEEYSDEKRRRINASKKNNQQKR